jgi:hypothetical protein
MDNFEEGMEIPTVLVALKKIKPPTPMAVVAERDCRIDNWMKNIYQWYPDWETRVVRDAESLANLMQNLASTDLVVFHIQMFQARFLNLTYPLFRFLRKTVWHTVVFDEEYKCDIFAVRPSARQYLLMYNRGSGRVPVPLSDLDTMLFLLRLQAPISDRRRAYSNLLTNYVVKTGP